MKTRWKVLWILCGCLAVLGLILCIAGAGMGATMSEVRSTYDVESTARELSWYSWDDDPDEKWELYDSENVAKGSEEDITRFSGIKEFSVDVSYLEVIIKPYDGEDIIVDVSQMNNKLKNNLVYKTNEAELSIESRNSKIWKRIGNTTINTLVIQIPEKSTFSEASFEVGAGTLNLEKINTDDLDIKVGAGNAVVSQFEARDLNVEVGAGKASLEGNVGEEANVECGVGELNITLNENQNNYDYKVKCGIGEVSVGDNSYTGLGSERNINNNTGRLIDINCGIGRIEVQFTDGI
jgi:DUF4097 and DUF4098 domain-containing protein YvlB